MAMIRNAVATALLAIGLATVASAHPGHVTVAEVEYDTEKRRVEVAMRLWPEDLEGALSRREGRDIDLETTEGLEEMIVAYVDERFLIAPPGDRPSPEWRPPAISEMCSDGEAVETPRITWVGKEFEKRDLWLYFEIRLPAGVDRLENAWVSNRVLLQTIDSQENILQIRDGDLRVTVRTRADQLWSRVAASDLED